MSRCAGSGASAYMSKHAKQLDAASYQQGKPDTSHLLPKYVSRATQWCQALTAALITASYPKLNAIVFSTFSCDTFDDGTRRLRAGSFGMDCDTNTQRFYERYATAMMAVWTFGVPSLLTLVLWRNQLGLARMRNVALNLESATAVARLTRRKAILDQVSAASHTN
eukprot:172798-Prymnesium_polylepis.1